MKRIVPILLLSASLAQAQVARVVTNGLVGWWTFEDGNVNDHCSTNHGTVVGSPSFASAAIGNAVSLNGSSQYVEINSLVNPSLPSICAWIKTPTPFTSTMMIVTKDGAAYQYTLRMNGTTGKLFFRVNPGDADYRVANGNQVLKTNQWYHVVGTYDGLYAKTYINGRFDSTSSGNSGVKVCGAQSATLRFGTRNPDLYFNGIIDEVKIFDRALSDQEIASLANARRPSQ